MASLIASTNSVLLDTRSADALAEVQGRRALDCSFSVGMDGDMIRQRQAISKRNGVRLGRTIVHSRGRLSA
jgi:hypothetical protein